MQQSRKARVIRLEMYRAQREQAGVSRVIRLEHDGTPEIPPEAWPAGPLIFLPRKAPSVEVWQEWCAEILKDPQEWQVHHDARLRHWLHEDEDV